VLHLLSLGIGEDAILQRLQQSPTVFTLDAAQVAALKQAGASERLLSAMAGNRPTPQPAGDVTDFAIVLDCSGSMMEATPEGQSKMQEAKKVVTDLMEKIPDGLRLTFIVYGQDKKLECQSVKVMRELSTIDAAGKSALAAAIASLEPAGATPIALALQTAGKELAKNDAYCGLALITDGKETCHGDPTAEAAALAKNLKLTFGVNVIGFDVNPDERQSLEAVAKAGHGKYYNAQSAAEFDQAVETLHGELMQVAASPIPPPADRPTRSVQFAGKEAKPGAFFQDAPLVEPGEYQGALAMMEAHYYQVPLSKGQELRAVGIVEKSPYQAYNSENSQAFSITIYGGDLAVLAREETKVEGNPTSPATVRATYTADSNQVVTVGIAASYNLSPSNDVYGDFPKPSPYKLRLRVEGEAAGGQAQPVPRLDVPPGNGFESAGVLQAPGLTATDLKLGEVVFYRTAVKKGDLLQVSAAAQKPYYRAMNSDIQARYTLTLYDDDQVQVAQKKLEVSMNPPDANSLVLTWPVELSGNAYVSVSCENSGEAVYPTDFQPKPGRVAVMVSKAGSPGHGGTPASGDAFKGAEAGAQ